MGAEFVAALLRHVERAAQDEGFEILAHCFMPNHLHLLVAGRRPDSDLRNFVKMCKQRCEFAARGSGVHSLWQRGYFERVLRASESPDAVIRYILDNPERAGLIAARSVAPFCGSKYRPKGSSEQ